MCNWKKMEEEKKNDWEMQSGQRSQSEMHSGKVESTT